ncbi:hypothetical protein BC826DRAFT_1104721 [Russula brevipes]|nr:hypothetical protein BC826DRAFT_1104721 [Russula brevipes]
MHFQSSRNTYSIYVSPGTNGTMSIRLAPAYAGPLTIEVIVDPPKKRIFQQTVDGVGPIRFTLAPALTGPLTIEVTIDPPKMRVDQQTVETQQTIRTQDVFPDFPNYPDDLITSETEPESLQEDAGATAASGKRKQASSAAKTPVVKRSKPNERI